MRCFIIFTIGVCLFITAIPSMADQAADEAAVRKAWEGSVDAYNNKDLKAFMGYIAEDFQGWGSGGRQSVEKNYKKYFETQKGARYKRLKEIGIIFITPVVAIYKAIAETSGLIDDDRKPRPASKNQGAWIWVKRNDKWLCVALFHRNVEE